MKKSTLLFLFLAFAFTLPFLTAAIHIDGQFHVVTCGLPTDEGQFLCTVCDLFIMVDNAFWYIIYISMSLAALVFLYGGFMMLIPGVGGEKSSGQYVKGKKAITVALISLALIWGAWLIINTIFKVLGGGKFGPWNEIKCEAKAIKLSLSSDPAVPREMICQEGETERIVNGYNVCDPTIRENIEKPPEGETLMKGPKYGCSAVSASPYRDDINAAASKWGVSKERLEALLRVESSLNPGAVSPKGAVGIAQILPSTATGFRPELKGTDVTAWLKNPKNAIDLGAQIYRKRMDENGGNHDRAAGGYNGGPKANFTSVNCPGIKRWECPWDSNGCWGTTRTDCTPNTGYNETRAYKGKMNTAEALIKSGTCV